MRISLLLLILIIFISGCEQKKTAQKPNIVLIMANDLGWKDVGYNRAKFYESPNIDNLAAD